MQTGVKDADTERVFDEIKQIVSKEAGCIGLAQIDLTIGDIAGNGLKIARYIRYAERVGLDMIVFPELALMGYPVEDIIDRHPVIVAENVRWIKELAKLCKNTTALVGFVEPRGDSPVGRRYYNSVAVLHKGEIQGIVRKRLLPTYSEFNDSRYIEPSPVAGVQPADTLGAFAPEKVVDMKKRLPSTAYPTAFRFAKTAGTTKLSFITLCTPSTPWTSWRGTNPMFLSTVRRRPAARKRNS